LRGAAPGAQASGAEVATAFSMEPGPRGKVVVEIDSN
jgi:hypothetical protein